MTYRIYWSVKNTAFTGISRLRCAWYNGWIRPTAQTVTDTSSTRAERVPGATPRRRVSFSASAVALLLLVAASAASAKAAEPAPGVIPRNGSRITATVLARKVWPAGKLENVRPFVSAGQTFHSAELEVLSAEPAAPGVDHLVAAGRKLEVFTEHVIPADAVGKTIATVITLVGDTAGLRWMTEGDVSIAP